MSDMRSNSSSFGFGRFRCSEIFKRRTHGVTVAVLGAVLGLAMVCLPASASEVTTSAKLSPKPATCTNVGQIWWNELIAPESETLSQFYASVIGWKTKIVDVKEQKPPASTPNDRYTVFVKGNQEIAGLMKLEHREAANSTAGWFVYIQVANVDASVAIAEEGGGSILFQPKNTMDGNRIAIIQDPQGNVFGLVTPKQTGKC